VRSALAILILLVVVPVIAEEAPPPSATLTRRLADFPVGSYVMVQAYEENVRHKLEVRGEDRGEKKTRLWNRFTFDLEVVMQGEGDSRRKMARVLVLRVQLGLEGDHDLTYDSDGKPEEQSAALREQFGVLVGGQAELPLATFGEGKGFAGLSEVWDRYAENHPESPDIAAHNRKSYGDSRLDRMFARGVARLFGAEAGRAAGKTRELTVGETFEVEAEILGIGRERAMSKHTVEVAAIADGHADLVVTWAENGHNPKTDGGVILMRGGDIEGRAEMRFHLASGLLVGLKETEKRVDQTCGMDMVQRTRYATNVHEFSIVRK
jgi:hypothetical protein